jgi:DNA-binding transcriptional regulator/RsmH inhibitor MraZ
MSQVVDYILTPKSATVVFKNGNPVQVPASDAERFQKVKQLIKSDDIEGLTFLLDKGAYIDHKTEGKFTVQGGVIVLDGEKLPMGLSSKLLELVQAGEDTLPLERFWKNLRKNPSQDARNDLFDFLKANQIAISKDGCIIVYKKVRDDFWDSHTGRTHQNKPGMTVSMPREGVDSNRNNTCSSGLHVADFEYAKGFTGTRLLEVKVNPADVVAVPPDYNQKKMRVCRYQVIKEITDKFTKPIYEDAAEKEVDKPLVEESDDVVYLNTDSEGRIRIPGHLIRETLRVGVGRRVDVYPNDKFLEVVRGNKKDKAEFHYVAQSDNCIRVSKKVLGLIEGGDSVTQFVVTADRDNHALIITPSDLSD